MTLESRWNSHRPVPALIGNGELVTFLGRSGYHDTWGSVSAGSELQEFVMPGRRVGGANHPLIPFGRLERRLRLDGRAVEPQSWEQAIHTDVGEVRTRLLYEGVLESTRSLILGHKNVFVAETRIINHSGREVGVEWELVYRFGIREGRRVPGLSWKLARGGEQAWVDWVSNDEMGRVTLITEGKVWKVFGVSAFLMLNHILDPGDEVFLRTIITFSDRLRYCDPVMPWELEVEMSRHGAHWRQFWAQSEVVTGVEAVDMFRSSALYTLACQCTPWSVPPVVAESPWGAGAFHDEYYPFVALVSGGWVHLAKRVPYFRLATLPRAFRRTGGLGALYPWSSTEEGEERDPHGHWHSERFHLGQIVAVAWLWWLYERRSGDLEELYPVLREVARYYEHFMLEKDERGHLRTRACTDFDEGAGVVAGGPFTMAAVVFALDRASEAARRLLKDREARIVWDEHARQLRQNLPIDAQEKRYTVPGGKPLHSSILGFAVPFFCDGGSELAVNSLRWVYERLWTGKGWKAGAGDAYADTSWLWTAGHIGMCGAYLGIGDIAWDAVMKGVASASQFLSPNEHLRGEDGVRVPWFTTGAGAWLAGLHWLFARVDDFGDYLLWGVPEWLRDFHFRGLRLSRGVSVSARVREGRLQFLSLVSPQEMPFSFEIPTRFVEGVLPASIGRVTDLDGWWKVELELERGANRLISGE
ncbi:MAG: hypothetical protein QXI19_03365 [Candidatus Caldarchaeum sp.]